MAVQKAELMRVSRANTSKEKSCDELCCAASMTVYLNSPSSTRAELACQLSLAISDRKREIN